MIYDYLLTAFKVVVGLITTERLIYGAAIALGFYLLWIMFSLAFSFQRRFNKNCVKLYNFIKKNNLNANDANSVDFKASKISSGFSHGWKKFKSAYVGKPSDFITRRDALDVEVNGGILNQGKTIMKSFINISTFLLFLVNFAYLGKDTSISCYLVAEAMLLPLLFFCVCKVFYFVYTSVKQQLYKADIECLYELLDLLDGVFAKNGSMYVAQSNFVQGEDAVATTDGEEVPAMESQEEQIVQEDVAQETGEEKEEEPAEEESENVGDKYDFFKKKNLDVDKLLNEVPNTSSSLPFINVDSDYVIKDDDAPAASKTISNLENGSALLGGMMQDMSSIKKNQKDDSEEPVEEKKEEEKAEESVEEKKEEPEENSKSETEDAFSIDAFEVAENAEEKLAEEPVEENAEEVENVEEEVVAEPEEEEEIKLEIPDVAPIELPEIEPEVEEIPVVDENTISDDKKESIATVVGGFKAKSKLASGGVVIERNQPISRREKFTSYEEPEEPIAPAHTSSYSDNNFTSGYGAGVPQNVPKPVTHLSVEENTDSILNTFRGNSGGFDDYSGYGAGMQGGMYNQGYSNPQYNQGYGYPQGGYNTQVNSGYGVQGYPNQNMQSQGFNSYNQPNSYEEESYDEPEEDYEEEVEETSKPTKKASRSKEDEPRPRNLKKKESKTAMAEEKTAGKTRGRPKKQVFDETVTIKNDKEFDEVLSRAEKLMKKSESGLSASQSKRIEKELKMLMDAMNKYKEGV